MVTCLKSRNQKELEEELEVTSGQLSSCLLLIMSILIGMTILFERVQDMMVEEAVESMKPAIKQMFAEMTILGFLSVVTYVLTSTGTLTQPTGSRSMSTTGQGHGSSSAGGDGSWSRKNPRPLPFASDGLS